jgi:hypothetical protein
VYTLKGYCQEEGQVTGHHIVKTDTMENKVAGFQEMAHKYYFCGVKIGKLYSLECTEILKVPSLHALTSAGQPRE